MVLSVSPASVQEGGPKGAYRSKTYLPVPEPPSVGYHLKYKTTNWGSIHRFEISTAPLNCALFLQKCLRSVFHLPTFKSS